MCRIIAVNYTAKAFGISRDDTHGQALAKCSNLNVIRKDSRIISTGPGANDPFIEKAECELLSQASQNVLDALVEYRRRNELAETPMENVSNDETYFDLTNEVNFRIARASSQSHEEDLLVNGMKSNLLGLVYFLTINICFFRFIYWS